MTLKLPQPLPRWDQGYQARHNLAAEAEDLRNRKIGTDVELGPGEKLIVRSPNGARWQLTVSNAGTVSATAL